MTKQHTPLTTAFIRELARKSPMEKHDRMLKENGEQTSYRQLQTILSQHKGEKGARLIAEDYTNTGVVLFSEGLRSGGGALFSPQFTSWLCGACRMMLDLPQPLMKDFSGAFIASLATRIVEYRKGRPYNKNEDFQIVDQLGDSLYHEMLLHKDYLLWEKYRKPVYSYSPDLAQMFLHTRLDTFPLDQLKLPHPVTEFVFPHKLFGEVYLPVRMSDEKVPGDLFGALVMDERAWGNVPNLRIIVYGAPHEGRALLAVHTVSFLTNEKRSVAEGLQDILKDTLECKGNAEAIQEAYVRIPHVVNFVVASIIYSTMPNADILLSQNSPEYQEWVKSIESRRLNRHQVRDVRKIRDILDQPHRYYLGRSVRIINRHVSTKVSGEGETHASPRMHVRAGHYHIYWTGPKTGPQVPITRYVEPVWVNVPEGEEPPDIGHAGMR